MGRRLGGGAQHVDALEVEPGHGHREAARGVLGEAQLVRRLVGPRMQRVEYVVATLKSADGTRQCEDVAAAVEADARAVDVEAEEHFGGRLVAAQNDLYLL